MELEDLKKMKLHEEIEVSEGQCSMIAKRVNGGVIYYTPYGYQIISSVFVPFSKEPKEDNKTHNYIRGVKIESN